LENESNIEITSKYKINQFSNSLKGKYKNSFKISGEDLDSTKILNSNVNLLTLDEGVSTSLDEDGIVITNTTDTGNLYASIGLNETDGCFDFTSLEGKTGKIGIDFQVTIEGNSGGGTYIRGYNQLVDNDNEEENRVVPENIIKKNTQIDNEILENYVTNSTDNVYFKITIPKGGSIKIHNIYMYMETEVTGFANMDNKITGGSGADENSSYIVKNTEELYNVLNEINDNPKGPTQIKIDGKITYDEWVEISGSKNRFINISSEIENLSIIGVGDSAIINGIGFKISGKNTIIKNLTIRYVEDGDCLQINNAKYTKVTHCSFYNEPITENTDNDKYDELLSAKNNAQYIVVSWCTFKDSWKTILVGSNDTADALPDRKLIFHHNLFENCNSRLPLYRGGYAHIYNNYFLNNTGSGINVRAASKIKIEGNYFENTNNPIGYWYDTDNVTGLWDLKDNIYDDCEGDMPTESTCDLKFEKNYKYRTDSTYFVKYIVSKYAGVLNVKY
jgi:pectate lyase